MEIVYDESTGTWGEREEPYTTLDVQTEEDWNKLEFMINNFSKLEEENAELKRLLRLAVKDMKTITINVAFEGLVCGGECARFFECERVKNNDEKMHRCCKFEWRHAEEALKLIGDEENV